MQVTARAFLPLVFAVTLYLDAKQTGARDPEFDVVSIKRNVSGSPSSDWVNRPNGGFTATNIRIDLLVARAILPQCRAT